MKQKKTLVVGLLAALLLLGSCTPQSSQKQDITTQPQELPMQSQPIPTTKPTEKIKPSPPSTTVSTQPQQFMLEADDLGFYQNGQDISSLSISKNNKVYLTFNVRTKNVYYGGLDFRGCGITSTRATPGQSTDMQFIADQSCTITSYWPAKNVKKDTLQIIAA